MNSDTDIMQRAKFIVEIKRASTNAAREIIEGLKNRSAEGKTPDFYMANDRLIQEAIATRLAVKKVYIESVRSYQDKFEPVEYIDLVKEAEKAMSA